MSNSNDLYPTTTISQQSLLIENENGTYDLTESVSKDMMYSLMLEILEEEYLRGEAITSPDKIKKYLQVKLAKYEHEVFAVVFLDNQHRIIAYEEMFRGTIDGASVYVREVAKRCLQLNAAACVFSHPHPSGIAEPSQSDIAITKRLVEALDLLEIRTLDHIIVGGASTVSMAERGLM